MNKSPSLSPPHISPQARRRAWLIVAMLGICLLAFGLRLYDLDGQSMWSDEGLSLYRARQPLAGIMANVITVDGVDTNDTNPPFYFLLLAGWRALFGERIFLLRYVGVLAGLLSVPLIYALGHTLFSTQVGAMAALFLALSPFHVWQTQVLRNYGLLITINLFSIYGLARFLFANGGAAGKWKWAALWLGAGLLGIYTHYFGFFIFAFTLLSLLAALVARHRARHVLPARRLVLGLLLILLLSSPALFSALARFNAGRQIDFYDVHTLDVVVQAASAFGVGMSPTLTHPWSWVLPGLLLFAAGIRMGWRCSRSATVLLLAYQVLPLGLLLAFSIVNPLFNGTRHLLIGLPPFLLIAAIGPGMLLQPGLHVARYVRPLALSLAALFLTLQVIWLQEQFHSPDLVRDDIRGAAEYLSRMAGPDDVVVLHDTLIKFTFDYYYDGQAPVIAIPLYGEQDEPEAISRLREAGREGEIVWFLTQPQPRTGFPRSVLWDWAEAHWKRLASETFAWMWLPLRLRAYTAAPEQAELPEEAAELHARFGDRIELQGASVPDSLQSGEPFDMTLYLSQDGRSAEDYEISLRFTDAAGQLWQQIEDGLWPAYPPAGWPAHGLVRYDHIARLPAGLPPGVYQVWMRIVDGQSKQPLLLASGEADLRLPDVAVSAAACEQKEQMGAELKRASALFGTDLTLEGYSQALETYRPGHVLALEVLWCMEHAPRQDDVMRVQMLDESGKVIAQVDAGLTRSDFPRSSWQPSMLLKGKIQFAVPATAPSGSYHLRLAVLSAGNERGVPVNLGLSGRSLDIGSVQVEAWPLETEFPPIENPLLATFGEPPLFELHGYQLGSDRLAPGDSVPLTLYWRSSVNAPPVNYYAFVHLIREGEQQPEAQVDGPPLQGFRLTSSWREGEVFVDERVLTIPADAPPGEYRLFVGLYNPDTAERLPVVANGERAPGDSLFLQQVHIVP